MLFWRLFLEYSVYFEHGTRHKVSYLIHYESLLQNATDAITKCDSYFITKCDRFYFYKLRQFYYKMRQFYYKMRQLLQNAMILLQNATIITKYDIYYKLRQYKYQKVFIFSLRNFMK